MKLFCGGGYRLALLISTLFIIHAELYGKIHKKNQAKSDKTENHKKEGKNKKCSNLAKKLNLLKSRASLSPGLTLNTIKLPIYTLPHSADTLNNGVYMSQDLGANTLTMASPELTNLKVFPTSPAAAPHQARQAPDGTIWWLALFGGYSGILGINNTTFFAKLDPTTGVETQYPLPGISGIANIGLSFDFGKDPVTGQFNNIAWIATTSNIIKFDMATGTILAVILATLRPEVLNEPVIYDLRVDDKGVPWYTEFTGWAIGRVDPVTNLITEYILPTTAWPRRLAPHPDGFIYFNDWNRGLIVRLNPNSNPLSPDTKEFPIPVPLAQPYGIDVTTDGAVWTSENNLFFCNKLVRFDPKTETYQGVFKAGAGTIRRLSAGPNNTIYYADTAVSNYTIATYPPLP